MPIHQTKLMMSNAQPTGTLLPQMPMPVDQQVADGHDQQHQQQRTRSQKPRNQPIGVRLVRTTWLIVSVTDSNVWPGAMTGGVRASSVPSAPSRRSCGCCACQPSVTFALRRAAPCRLELRVRVPHGRQVRRPRPRVQLGEQRVVQRLAFSFATRLFGIVDVAEDDRVGRTGRLARGLASRRRESADPRASASTRASLMRCTQ